jgi:excisionase family DNA binding protein
MASDLLDAKEVAHMLRVSVRTVVRLAERGELVAFKVGDLWRFRRSDVDTYIQQQIQRQKRQDDR